MALRTGLATGVPFSIGLASYSGDRAFGFGHRDSVAERDADSSQCCAVERL